MKKNNYLEKRLLSLFLAIIIMTTSSTYNSNKPLTKKELSNYKKYFKELSLGSKSDKYEELNEKVDNFLEKNSSLKKCPYEYNGNLNILIKQIELNSIKYTNNYSDLYSPFITEISETIIDEYYTEENLKVYRQVFEKALQRSLTKIITTAQNNINEDICRMQTLKIAFSNTESGILGEYKPEENLIILSAPQILGLIPEITTNNMEEEIKYLEDVISHELNHLRQHTCPHKTLKPFCLNYSEPTISTLLESSAESIKYNTGLDNEYLLKETYDYSYQPERNQEALLFLLNLFNNKEVTEYYSSILDTEVDKFNEFFDAKTEDEIYDLYRIIYYIDMYNGRVYPLSINESKLITQELKSTYKLEIYNKVLSNMLAYTNNSQTFTLEENLTILSLVQDIILSHEYEDKSYFDESTQQILSQYEEKFCHLTNKYKEFLCTYYGITKEKLKEETQKAIKITNGLNNYLSEDQIKIYQLLEKYPVLKSILYVNLYNINKNIKTQLEEEYPSNIEQPSIIRDIKKIELDPKKIIKQKTMYTTYYKQQTGL